MIIQHVRICRIHTQECINIIIMSMVYVGINYFIGQIADQILVRHLTNWSAISAIH